MNNVIAAFKSKKQMMSFDIRLRSAGINTRIVPTPRVIALGCGLSVQFDAEHLTIAKGIASQLQLSTFEGFYSLIKENGRIKVRKIY